MKAKLKVLLLACFAMCMSLCFVGCQNGAQQSSDAVHYVDDEAVQAIAKGLEARWAYTNSDKTQSMSEAVRIELEAQEGFPEGQYKDLKLQELVLTYRNALSESKEVAPLYEKDPAGYSEKWNALYDKRTTVIRSLANEYGMTVSSENQATLDDLILNADAAEQIGAEKEAVEKMASSLKFKCVEDSYGYKTYRAKAKNTCNYDLKFFSLEVNLYSKKNTRIDTTYASVNNWAKGETVNIEFTTDKSFKKSKIVLSYYEIDR